MHPYVTEFKNFFNENQPDYPYEDIHTLLELFGSYYIMCNPIESDEIKNQFYTLEPIIKSLSRRREHRLIHTIRDICEVYKRISFQEGIRVGAQLIMELYE